MNFSEIDVVIDAALEEFHANKEGSLGLKFQKIEGELRELVEHLKSRLQSEREALAKRGLGILIQFSLELSGGLEHFFGLQGYTLNGLFLQHSPKVTGSLDDLQGHTLSELGLDNCPEVTGSLDDLKDHTLSGLRLQNCGEVTGSLTDLQSHALNQLGLQNCPKVTGSLVHLKDHTLNELGLQNCPKVTGSLVHLKDHTLNELWLQNCGEVTGRLTDLQGHALNQLGLQNCSQLVDDDSLIRFAEYRQEHFEDETLETLDLRGSGITFVDEAVFSGSARDVLSTVLAGVHLLMARVAIVGEGAVGKTFLAQRIFLDKTPVLGPHVETDDIDIHRGDSIDWNPQIEMRGKDSSSASNGTVSVELYVWDFGGQWILRNLHHEFMAKDDRRTIYLTVVAANRVPDGDTATGNRLHYWLRTIQRFAGSEAPVVIVISQCHQFKASDLRAIDAPLTRYDGKPLREVTPDELSNQSSDGSTSRGTNQNAVTAIFDGFDSISSSAEKTRDLRTEISHAVATLSSLHGKRKVSKHLRDLASVVTSEIKNHHLVPLDDFKKWYTEAGLDLPDETQVVNDLRVLHHLGIVFYFGRRPTTQQRQAGLGMDVGDLAGSYQSSRTVPNVLQKHVANPIWLKRPVYQVLRTTPEKGGYLTRNDIEAHVNAKDAAESDTEPEFAFEFLKYTECCADLQNDVFFFPCGLPLDGTNQLPAWAKPHNPIYQESDVGKIQWSFLPLSRFHRLMAYWLDKIVDQKHWHTGMVVSDKKNTSEERVSEADALAAVIAHPEEDAVEIILHGGTTEDRRDLWRDLCRDLEHATRVGQADSKQVPDWADFSVGEGDGATGTNGVEPSGGVESGNTIASDPSDERGNGQGDIDSIEKEYPALDVHSSEWIHGTQVKKVDGLLPSSLKSMRHHEFAQKNKAGTFGIDKAGRVWRKESASAKKVYYLRCKLLNPQASSGGQ